MTLPGEDKHSRVRVVAKKRVDSSKGNVRKDEMKIEYLLMTERDGSLAGNSEKRRAHNLLNSDS